MKASGTPVVGAPTEIGAPDWSWPADQLWRAVFENTAVGVGLLATTGRVLAANAPLQRMLGYSERELQALTFLDFTHPDDLASATEALTALTSGRLSENRLRKRCIRKDGTLVWTETSLSSVPPTGTHPMLIPAVVADITDRVQAEEALSLLVNVTAEAGMAPDIPSMVMACLRRVCDARGWQVGEAWFPDADGTALVCYPEASVLSPDIEEFRTVSLQSSFAMGIGLPGRVWASRSAHWVVDVGVDPNFPRGDVARRTGLMGAFAFPLMLGGEVLAVFEFFARELRPPDPALLDAVEKLGHHLGEILELKRRTEALHDAQAVLARVSRLTTMGELTASIAHEVNQPLAAIVANAGASRRWLGADPPNLAEVRSALQAIIENGNRASEVIGRVRRLLQRSGSERRRLDINEVIEESLRSVWSEATRRRIAVRTELADGPPPILGDPIELQQVLLNLMVNGIEAMAGVTTRPRILTILTTIDSDPPGVRVTVRDSGAGPDPKVRHHMFDAFVSTRQEGLGLGLAISRSLAESHGGRLSLLDGGAETAFELWLPAADAA